MKIIKRSGAEVDFDPKKIEIMPKIHPVKSKKDRNSGKKSE